MIEDQKLETIGIGIVFNKNGELLIDQRLENTSMSGKWEFPGGKKEHNETIINTIEREIREEIDIIVDVKEKLLTFEHVHGHLKLTFIVYICEYLSGEPQPLASKRLLWISPSQLSEFSFPPANIKIIDALHNYLSIH